MSWLGCKALFIIINFHVLWFICFSSSLDHFKNGPWVSYKVTALVFTPLDEISTREFGFEKFSHSTLELISHFFLSSLFVWCCLLPIFSNICRFSSLQAFWFFPDLAVLFIPLFVFLYFSLWTWHLFNFEFHFCILVVYSYCLYQSLQFFFIFLQTTRCHPST